MDELKACPFCGGHIYAEEYPSGIDAHCTNKKCILYGKSLFCLTIDKLNTRPIEDALRAELAAKDAEIERLRDALQERKPIPVSERMPEEGLGVMLFDSLPEYWTIGYLYRLSEDRYQWATIDRFYFHDDNFARVTHWMPLPPAPHIFNGR